MTGFIVIGISHKTAPVEVRERFSFTRSRLAEAMRLLEESGALTGGVILFTCNRMEIYACSSSNERCIAYLTEFLAGRFGLGKREFKKYFYILKNERAVRHILEVACGLDSQVLGEREILNQVKAAHLAAREAGFTTDFLDAVFEKAVAVGSFARQSTKISQGKVSIGSVAMELLKKRFKILAGRSVLIIGAGKISKLMSKYLKEEGIRGFFISNRTYAKACELARLCGGEAVKFDGFLGKLKEVDIVISSTASPHIILRKETVEEIMRGRKKPLLLLDLTVPRDLEPEVRTVAGVSLYDLDDLKCVIEKNHKAREKEAALVHDIIERELKTFCRGVFDNSIPFTKD